MNFADDIKDAKERGWVIDTHDDTDWYEFYEDGYYVSNHFESRIDRFKVETFLNFTIMKRHFIITIKEFGNDKLLKTEYTGNIDHNGLIKFFGLHNPDVEWYIIEEVTDK